MLLENPSNKTENIPMVFQDVERRLSAKRTAIRDLENEYNLLERQAYETYQRYVYYPFSQSEFETLSKWLPSYIKGVDSEGNKISKQKNSFEKRLYKDFTKQLEDLFNVTGINIFSIVDFNYSQAYDIKFNYDGITFELAIPNVKTVSFDFYTNYGNKCFGLSLSIKVGDNIYSEVGVTFDENNLHELMKSGIERFRNGEL